MRGPQQLQIVIRGKGHGRVFTHVFHLVHGGDIRWKNVTNPDDPIRIVTMLEMAEERNRRIKHSGRQRGVEVA